MNRDVYRSPNFADIDSPEAQLKLLGEIREEIAGINLALSGIDRVNADRPETVAPKLTREYLMGVKTELNNMARELESLLHARGIEVTDPTV